MIMFDDDDGDHHRQHHIACLLFLPMATWPSSHCARYCVDTKKNSKRIKLPLFFQNESIRKNITCSRSSRKQLSGSSQIYLCMNAI